MMWLNKKKNLKASYYHTFLALIVIPILLIIIISSAIIRTMMVDSAPAALSAPRTISLPHWAAR